MPRAELEQLLNFATHDWRADWRGNFGGESTLVERGADFVSLYLYVHRVRDCEPGVYRWRESNAGKAAQIELEALAPKPMTLHWLKVLRVS